jgi:hypothetical protein
MQRSSTNDDHVELSDEPGAFSWNIASNTLHGDGSVAKLYGFEAHLVLGGLPLQAYIEKIHAEDRSSVAKAIHSAIISGEAYNARFRIVADNMTASTVMACGRCFRDATILPLPQIAF